MIRRLHISLLFIFFIGQLQAQILKVNKVELDVDSSGFFQGSINVNLNINNRASTPEQDATFVGLNGQGDVVYFSDKNAYIFITTADYYSISKGPFVSTGYVHFRINFMRKKKVSVETFAQGQYDAGRNMPARFLQGAGLKFRLSKSKRFMAYLGTGIMWEYERWKYDEAVNGIIEKKLFKSTNYLNSKYKINDAVDLNNTIYYQTGYDRDPGLFRNRISADVNLTVKLTDRLSFVATFTSQYEDEPIIPIKKFIYALTNGLKLTF